MPDDKLLDIFYPDECCNRRLSKAIKTGLKADAYVCSKCGTEWKAERKTGEDGTPYRKWSPVCPVEIIRV